MNDGNPSGLADCFGAITYSLVSRAYVNEKYDKSDKTEVQVGGSEDYVEKYPDKSDGGNFL